MTVASAVIAHDFCDGLNTVSLMLRQRHTQASALGMLALDALAPVLGVLSTFLFTLPPQALTLFLGFFAGFLLYIASADILPQAHSRAGPARALHLIGLTVLGVVAIYGVKQMLPEG
jgi:ZIP family zinc transporter